ncbi:hypothetical protein V2J09_022691 [Rumex salicifolius]
MIDNGLPYSSPSTRHGNDMDMFLLLEFNKLMEDFDMSPRSDVSSTPFYGMDTTNARKDEYEQEIQSLKSIVIDLRERESCLKIKLLEYYGLKEQEITLMELLNKLKINKVEAKALLLTSRVLAGREHKIAGSSC